MEVTFFASMGADNSYIGARTQVGPMPPHYTVPMIAEDPTGGVRSGDPDPDIAMRTLPSLAEPFHIEEVWLDPNGSKTRGRWQGRSHRWLKRAGMVSGALA